MGLLIAAGVTWGAAFVGAADATAGGSTDGTSVSRGHIFDAPDCQPVAVGSGEFPAELLARGWSGDPTDGVEALYPPGCLTHP